MKKLLLVLVISATTLSACIAQTPAKRVDIIQASSGVKAAINNHATLLDNLAASIDSADFYTYAGEVYFSGDTNNISLTERFNSSPCTITMARNDVGSYRFTSTCVFDTAYHLPFFVSYTPITFGETDTLFYSHSIQPYGESEFDVNLYKIAISDTSIVRRYTDENLFGDILILWRKY